MVKRTITTVCRTNKQTNETKRKYRKIDCRSDFRLVGRINGEYDGLSGLRTVLQIKRIMNKVKKEKWTWTKNQDKCYWTRHWTYTILLDEAQHD